MEREPRKLFAELHVNGTALLFSSPPPQAGSLDNALIEHSGMELYRTVSEEEQA